MPPRLKAILQYTVIILITIILTWFSLKGIQVGESENKGEYLLKTWRQADKGWLLVMAAVAMLSHIIRAHRWNLLLQPTGHNPTLKSSFISLMTGYLVNLAIPRGGEVSRCYNLFKLEKVPVEVSFGTVVVERVVDLMCLLLLIGLTFVLESERLISFLQTLQFSDPSAGISVLLYIFIGLVLVAIAMVWLVKRNAKLLNLTTKIWRGIKNGLLSVFKLKRKGIFIFHSLVIWLLYFMMSYAVIQAFPATAHLGFSAVVSLFGIGSIAMAAPLPGGTGSYHVLVPQGLVFLYGISNTEATAFTFIFHGWQTVIMIISGAISLIATSLLIRKK